MDELEQGSIDAVIGFAVVTERYQHWWETGERMVKVDSRWAAIADQVAVLKLRHGPSTQHQWFLVVARTALDIAEEQGRELEFSEAFQLAAKTVRVKCLAGTVARV